MVNSSFINRNAVRVECGRRLPLPLTPLILPTLSRLFSHHCSQSPLSQITPRLRPLLSPRPTEPTPTPAHAGSPSLVTTLAQRSADKRNFIYYSKGFRRSRSEFCTFPTSIQRFHVEDVNALHFTEDFETLETGGLVDVGGDGTGLGSGGEEVFFCLDVCGRGEAVNILLGCRRGIEREMR